MVTNFRRSLSFPNQPHSSTNKNTKHTKTLHVRSTSLPCHASHPIISQLKHQISQLTSWSLTEPSNKSSAWLCRVMSNLKSVHDSLDDFLTLPQTRELLRKFEDLVEKFLENFLKFVDVYGMFRSLVLRVREEYASAQIAVRRKEESKVVSHCKNLRNVSKEIGKLVSIVPTIGKLSVGSSCEDEFEIVGVINDVVNVTILVTVAFFGGISSSLGFKRTSTSVMGIFRRKMKSSIVEGVIREFGKVSFEGLRNDDVGVLPRKMYEVEDCMIEIESCGDKVFRSLINTRVSLLNVLTQ